MAYRFNPFTSQLDFYQEDTQFVSSGGIANLTSGQQDQIREGSIVTTTDGRRWAYSGTGSKTLEASYVELADITPEWSVIAGKPAIPTAAPAAGQIMAGNAGGTAFATVSVSGDATLAATGALTIANNAVTNAKLAAAATATLKGRTAPGTGDVSDLTASDVRALLNVADGAEANVQANWTETNAALDSFIQNKPTLGGAALLNVGSTTGTVAAGDDSRLSDARTPTSHTHGNLTNDGKIGSTAGLPVVTGTAGVATTLALGTAGQVLSVNSTADGLEFATPSGGGGGGTKTFVTFTPDNNQPPATNFATLDTRNSIAILDFDDTTDENAIFLSVIPEAASLGSGLKIRLIWTATTATSGDCVWDAALERMNTDIDTDSFDTAASVTTTTNGTSGVPNYSEITLTTIDSVVAGDGFRLKITRDADNASDTMTGDAELIAVEVRSAA